MSKTRSRISTANRMIPTKPPDPPNRRYYVQEDETDSCMVTLRSLRELAEKEANLVQSAMKDMENNLIDPGYILDLTKSIHGSGSKNIADYINRNTEILLNEHATIVRQKVTQKMKKQIQDMNEEMSQDAKKLGEDISNFFEFIQSNYELAANSFKKVVEKAKENYKKVETINDSQEKLFSLKSELQDLEQQLLECLMCSAFLTSLTYEGDDQKRFPIPKEFLRSFGPTCSAVQSAEIQKKVLEDISHGESFEPLDVSDISADDVMKVIGRLKDSNLSLVRNSPLNSGSQYETTELEVAKRQMNEEITAWDAEIVDAEEDLTKAKEAHEKLKRQLSDLVKEDADRKKMEKENEMKQIATIYKLCTGSEAKVRDLVLMRTAINHTIEGLINEINVYPRKKVKELIKTLEAEKKQSERKMEEMLRAQRANERLKKALQPPLIQGKKQSKR